MKKFLFTVIAVLGLITSAMAQSKTDSYKKRPTLGINFFLQDMKTAELISKTSLSSVLSDRKWAKFSEMDPGLSVQYFEGLTGHIDFMATLGGSFVKYPFYPKSGVKPPLNSKFLLELDAAVNIKLLTDQYFLVPYLTLGVGTSMYAGTYFAAYAPAGAGLQFNLGDGVFVNTQFTYKAAISDLSVNHLSYSIGIASPLTDKKEPVALVPPPPPPVAEKDSDGDGIADSKDKCPSTAGVAKYNGCPVPDTDGDGINDDNDKCITVKGLPKYNGCPVPDADKDGIHDEEDKCPSVAGVARYQGCPVPDTDKDGVNDEEDKCPTVAGTSDNNGCPAIKEDLVGKVNNSARNILFVTGSDKLLAKSYKWLDEVAGILKQDAALKLDIEGHTDNTGSDKINLPLSQKRAKAVYNYLAEKAGIDGSRMNAAGFGSSKPVADNKTPKNRALNRRVALKLKY